MRKISLWAKKNILAAQILLVCCHIILAMIACYVGLELLKNGIFLTKWFLYGALTIWLLAIFAYPPRALKHVLKNYYLRQKSSDFLIAFSTALVICYGANAGTINTNSESFLFATNVVSIDRSDPTAQEILKSLQHRDKSTLSKKEKRILKREFKSQLGVYVKAKVMGDDDKAGNAALIILTIIGALGLLYLVAALACSLSCNGMDGAAIAVALLGTTAVIFLTIAIIRRIKHGPKRKEPEHIEAK